MFWTFVGAGFGGGKLSPKKTKARFDAFFFFRFYGILWHSAEEIINSGSSMVAQRHRKQQQGWNLFTCRGDSIQTWLRRRRRGGPLAA